TVAPAALLRLLQEMAFARGYSLNPVLSHWRHAPPAFAGQEAIEKPLIVRRHHEWRWPQRSGGAINNGRVPTPVDLLAFFDITASIRPRDLSCFVAIQIKGGCYVVSRNKCCLGG